MWSTFFRDGGWGMWPVAVDGFLLVAAGVLVVLRPERRHFALVSWLWLTTLGGGLLGTAVGVVKSFRAAPELPADQQLIVALLGCSEALNCTVFALLFCTSVATLAAVAAARVAWSGRPAAG